MALNDQLISEHMDNLDKSKATLDWFGFETRIRNIVYELLSTPMETVKKMMDRQESIDQSIDFNKRRIDEHDFLCFKSLIRPAPVPGR